MLNPFSKKQQKKSAPFVMTKPSKQKTKIIELNNGLIGFLVVVLYTIFIAWVCEIIRG